MPSIIVDSLGCEIGREVRLHTPDVLVDEPLTETRFLLGSHRRFIYDLGFRRRTGESSGIMVMGSSNGMHAWDGALRHSMRQYFLKYGRELDSGGAMSLVVRGLRDRDGLADLDARRPMGERRTDDMSVSAAVNGFPLGGNGRTRLDTSAWYQSGRSRIDQYGVRRSLDDDFAGWSAGLVTTRGLTTYSLTGMWDVEMFDSRIHDETWSRHIVSLGPSMHREGTQWRIGTDAVVMSSSDYGAGYRVTIDVERRIGRLGNLRINASSDRAFPDTGMEYFTSLVFSDTSHVADLDVYDTHTVEAGWRRTGAGTETGVFISFASTDMPSFLPAGEDDVQPGIGAGFGDGARRGICGYRAYLRLHGGGSYRYTFDAGLSGRTADDDNAPVWPYPSGEAGLSFSVSRSFFDGNLVPRLFADSAVHTWESSGTAGPDGTYLFLDGGLVVNLGGIEAFYRMENIAGEEVDWFRAFGWTGRNGMWGLRWSLTN